MTKPSASTHPTVQTTSGAVLGSRCGGIFVFKGVPYGGDTSGVNRFMPPTRPAHWDGVREALAWGSSCPQPEGSAFNVTPEISAVFGKGEKLTQSEDCLVLNVWTPGLGDGVRRPVMFWCHGGGFTVGSASGSWYDGTNLARRGDVVVVTVNHRLGPLGYLHLADLGGSDYAASGNAGMLDLVAALEWVRDNIVAFGGDPDNVTIFGESGGGAKVSVLLAMPAAQGLFHKALIQSGPGLRMRSRARAVRHARRILTRLKIDTTDLAALHTVPAEELIAAHAGDTRRNPYRLLEPVVDGHILPHPPFEPQAPAISAEIPLLIGTNRDEATLFVGNIPLLGTFAKPSFLAPLALHVVMRLLVGRSARRIIRTYSRNRPDLPTNRLFIAMASDWTMTINSIRLAERKVRGGTAPVYMYRLTWESPALEGKLGATHAIDLPFVFDNVSAAAGMVGKEPEAFTMADRISEAWIAFARTGNPNHNGLPNWPAYDLADRATMFLDDECHVTHDPARDEREAWTGARMYAM